MRYERSDAQEQLLLSYVLATAVVAEEGILDRDAFEGVRSALQVGGERQAMVLMCCRTAALRPLSGGHRGARCRWAAVEVRCLVSA